MSILSAHDVDGRKYDVVILGSGMGGAAAALRAASLGLKPLIVEKGSLGGTCVNVGCVPTKYLLKIAETYGDLRTYSIRGLIKSVPGLDLGRVMARKTELIEQVISWYADYVFPSCGVDVVRGDGRLLSRHVVKINGYRVEANNIVLATGSSPIIPSIMGMEEALDKGFALTSDGILALDEVPDRLLIIGGGAIGVEMATIWNRFGSKVTIVEMMPRLLPQLDADIGKALARALMGAGITVVTSTRATRIDADKGRVYLDNGEYLKADKVLVAVGRKPNSRGIGLENLGVKLGPKGEVIVDNRAETSVEGIYAVGDVTGEPFVASKAKVQGIVAGENIAGINSRYELDLIPLAIFSDPEVGSVGVSAYKGDPNYIVKRFPAGVNYRAIASERIEGIAKIVARASDEVIVGFHMVGLNASEVVNVAAIAIKKQMKMDEAMKLVFSHPVMSELFIDAISLAKGVNVYLPKR